MINGSMRASPTRFSLLHIMITIFNQRHFSLLYSSRRDYFYEGFSNGVHSLPRSVRRIRSSVSDSALRLRSLSSGQSSQRPLRDDRTSRFAAVAGQRLSHPSSRLSKQKRMARRTQRKRHQRHSAVPRIRTASSALEQIETERDERVVRVPGSGFG